MYDVEKNLNCWCVSWVKRFSQMPREVVTVQIGQCGNQMGLKWWDVVLQEMKANYKHPDALSSLFYETESKGSSIFSTEGDKSKQIDEAVASGKLKARCMAIDTEEGVLSSMVRGPLGNLFDASHFVSDVSGAGNNWAVGHLEYGDRHAETISESVRQLVEKCDSLQTFVLMHSLSGGTGSGLGTRVLSILEDDYPSVFRFSSVVMPSAVEDVVIAPYNTCFSLRELIEHSDCVLPLDNDALAEMADRALVGAKKDDVKGHTYNAADPTLNKKLPYDTMNAIAAQMLSNVTCSMRYPGQLNMDINEITTNLVPYQRLHFLVSSIAPLFSTRQTLVGTKQLDSMFERCLEPSHSLVRCDTRRSTFLAAALVARGESVNVADVSRNIGSIKRHMKMVHWNENGFKSSICSVPPIGVQNSLLMLSNSCGFASNLSRFRDKFMKLYRVKSHVHHYQEYLELPYFDATLEILNNVIDDYSYLNTVQPPKDKPRSMREMIL